ncbi:MAG: hypothetical protein JKY37_00425, partial [Nannocystaceae bacterium]|nr:hypothetical protein [Nannocystaceae bacterium]
MLSRTLLALTVCLAAACRDQPDALSGAPAPAATASLAARVDLGRPLSPAAPQEPHKQAAPIYDGSEKTVMLDPSGCAPVVFEFTPPQGFDFDAKSNAAKWSRAHGPRTPLAIQTEKAWLDFIELDGYCADRRDAA